MEKEQPKIPQEQPANHIKVPKKRGRKPKAKPNQRLVIIKENITLSFD
jgi:hypothetical protein